MTVRFVPPARRELARAAIIYERRSVGLGDRLLENVGRAIRAVREYPNAHPQLDRVHRRILVSKFPYALIYRQEPGIIWIIAVAHTSRRPGYWSRRKVVP